LVKCGNDVLVSTPNAVSGAGLGELRRAVEQSQRKRDEREHNARAALEKIEADFVRRFIELEEHA
jgi:F-type H+-transporting ATPase subunit epsilon